MKIYLNLKHNGNPFFRWKLNLSNNSSSQNFTHHLQIEMMCSKNLNIHPSPKDIHNRVRHNSPKCPRPNGELEVKGDEQSPNGNGLWFQLEGWKLCLWNKTKWWRHCQVFPSVTEFIWTCPWFCLSISYNCLITTLPPTISPKSWCWLLRMTNGQDDWQKKKREKVWHEHSSTQRGREVNVQCRMQSISI